MSTNLQHSDVQEILKDKKLAAFIIENLLRSLSSIGFSKSLLDGLLNNLGNLAVKEFGEKWQDELRQIYSIGFYQNLVPKYFSDYVVPVTPASSKIIDVGCGTGILAKLYAQEDRFGQVIGIDINSYPEWEMFRSNKIRFEVLKEEGFTGFLKTEKPDSIVLTWTLHHMDYDEQERYIGYIHQHLKSAAKILIMEDSYPTTLAPENGKERYEKFMKWNINQRKKIMSVYDWVANRALNQRAKIPIPCSYRTLEQWSELLEKKGFKTSTQKFIGFPDNRDINTPQSLIVARKN
jgi:SAM-dependent methyltransferase